MIPHQWYALLTAREVRARRPLAVTRLGERLVLWRAANGALACARDQCPHRGAALSLGTVAGGELVCPFHGFHFARSGACTCVPANGRRTPAPPQLTLHTYPVREAHGFVWLWWGSTPADPATLPPIPWFDAIPATMHRGEFHDDWAVHYTRAIENQLDVVHLPFIHRTTIGRANHSVVHGPVFQWAAPAPGQHRLDIWVTNAPEQGQRAQRADELPPPTGHPMLQLILPNLWHLWIADKQHIVIAFAPIDAGHTRLYFRTYQSFMPLPVLRNLMAWLNNRFSDIIQRQDKRVVLTQPPPPAVGPYSERLIPGDAPIVAFRRRRDELLRAGEAEQTQLKL